MTCPLCGAGNTTGLRYCTRCGGNLLHAAPNVDVERLRQTEHGWDIEKIEPAGISVKRLTGLFWAVAVFSLISLIVLFGISVPLTLFGAPRQVMIPLYMFGSAAVVLIAGMLIKQIARLITMMQDEGRASRPMLRQTAANPPQVAAPPPAFRSVTEHTTRNFEAAYRDAGEHQ
jgi:hypothetical protein